MHTTGDLRLALTLIRGARRRDVVRLLAMSLGVGLAVLAALVGIAAPRVSAQAHQVEVDRSPVLSDRAGAVGGLLLSTSAAMVNDRTWSRVSVSGADPHSPLPPGLSAWPVNGETVASPALRDLASHNPQVAGQLGRLAPITIGEAGLTGPDELFSYTSGHDTASAVRAPGQQARTAVVTGFGNEEAVTSSGPGLDVIIEVGLLVLLPAAVFLLTALRLSAVSRTRRTFALGLAGMSPSRASRLYAWEMSIVAILGYGLAAITYQATQARIGASGMLGVRWWPGQGSLGTIALATAGVLTVVMVSYIARRSMQSAAKRSRSERTQRSGRAVLVAGILGVPALGFLGVVNISGFLHPSATWANDNYAAEIAVAVVASMAAVLVGMPRVISSLGSAAARRTSPAVALGLRGAAFRVSSGKRLIAFVATSVMLAGLGTAFLASIHRGAFGDPANAQISFDISQVAQDPGWASHLPTTAPFTIETSLRGQGGNFTVVVGDCAGVEKQAAVVFPDPGTCTDTIQRGSAGFGGTSAVDVQGHRVEVPRAPVTPNVMWDVKFPVREAPWLPTLKAGEVTYWVSRNDASYATVLADLTKSFPNAKLDAGLKNPDQYATYRQQIGTIRAAIALGILLSITSFILAALESRWERSRSIATLSALGLSRRTLRIANVVEFGFPIVAAALPAALIGLLGGWAVLSFRGTDGMFSSAILGWTVAGALVATLIATMVGWASGGASFDREALADT